MIVLHFLNGQWLVRLSITSPHLTTISLHFVQCVLGAGGDFTAQGLFAISFCIDSVLKAIDFHPAE